MPIYEYRCKECSNKFERMLEVSEFKSPQSCDCGGESTRLISMFSFVDETSPNRPIDCVVGKDAEKRWGIVHDRKANRQKKNKKG